MTPKSSISLLSFPLSTHRDYDFWVYLADPAGQTKLRFQSQFRVGNLEKLSRLSPRSKRCCALLVPLSRAFLLHAPIFCLRPTIPCSQLCAPKHPPSSLCILLRPTIPCSRVPLSLCPFSTCSWAPFPLCAPPTKIKSHFLYFITTCPFAPSAPPDCTPPVSDLSLPATVSPHLWSSCATSCLQQTLTLR